MHKKKLFYLLENSFIHKTERTLIRFKRCYNYSATTVNYRNIKY